MSFEAYPLTWMALLAGIFAFCLANFQIPRTSRSERFLSVTSIAFCQIAAILWCWCVEAPPDATGQQLARQILLMMAPLALASLMALALLLTNPRQLGSLGFVLVEVNLLVLALVLFSPLVLVVAGLGGSGWSPGPLFLYGILSLVGTVTYGLFQLGWAARTRQSLARLVRARFLLGLASWTLLISILLTVLTPGPLSASTMPGAFVAGSFIASASLSDFLRNEGTYQVGFFLRKLANAESGRRTTLASLLTVPQRVQRMLAGDRQGEPQLISEASSLFLGPLQPLLRELNLRAPSISHDRDGLALDVENARLLTLIRASEKVAGFSKIPESLNTLPHGLDIGFISEQAETNIARNKTRFGVPLIAVSPSALEVLAFLSSVELTSTPIVLAGPPNTAKRTTIRAVHASRCGTDLISIDLSDAASRQGIHNNLGELLSGHALAGVMISGWEYVDPPLCDAIWPLLSELAQRSPVYLVIDDAGPSGPIDYILRSSPRMCRISALRDRPLDLVYLACWMAQRLAQQEGKSLRRIEAFALYQLLVHPWPGNASEVLRVTEASVRGNSNGNLLSLTLSHISMDQA